MQIDDKAVLRIIDQVVEEWNAFSKGAQQKDCSDKSIIAVTTVTNRLASVLDKFALPGSVHKRSLEKILAEVGFPFVDPYMYHERLVGVLLALRRDYELGQLQSVAELVHADTFADLIEMASYLREQGYKDPAAVIVGSVLEQHLRELCNKNGNLVLRNGKNKKADLLNTELAKQNVYNKIDQKSVTSWLGLRNNAAHGNYDKYTTGQVQVMIDAVRNFVVRYPA